MLLGVKTALKVINVGNNDKKLNSIIKHKDHILLEFKDNKIYIIRLSELKIFTKKQEKTIIRKTSARKRSRIKNRQRTDYNRQRRFQRQRIRRRNNRKRKI